MRNYGIDSNTDTRYCSLLMKIYQKSKIKYRGDLTKGFEEEIKEQRAQ